MKTQFNQISIIACILVASFTSCELMPDVTLPVVVTHEASNIQKDEVVLSATFTVDENRSVMVKRAFEFSNSEETLSSQQYYFDDEWTTLSGSTTISVSMNSLSPGTTYYYRAVLFPKNADYSAPIYGNTVSFTTTGTPANANVTITTEKVTSVTSTTVRVYGKCSASNVTIVDVGTLINKGQAPTIDNNLGVSSFKKYAKSFRTFWYSLTPATEYYVRSYAKDSKGIYYYSNVLTFTTKSEPGGSLTVNDFVGTYTLNAYSPWEKKNVSWTNVQFTIYKGDTLNATGWNNHSKFKTLAVFDKGLQVVRCESNWYFEDLSFSHGDSTVYAIFTPVWYNSANDTAYFIESGGKSTYGEIWLKQTSTNNYEFVACDGDSDDGYYANGFLFLYESVKYFSSCGNSYVYTNVKMKRTSTSTTNAPRRISTPSPSPQIIKQHKQQHYETESNHTAITD